MSDTNSKTTWEVVKIPKSFIIRKFTSKKSGKPCVALLVNLGYTNKFLTFDYNVIAELLCVSVSDLMNRNDFETVLCTFE